MKLSKIYFVSFFIILSFILVKPLFAEVAPIDNTNGASYTLSTLDIQNTKIVSQKNNLFNLSFDISNGSVSQAGLKYSVSLVKQISKDQSSVLDEYVYPESLSISANSLTKKEITYTAPSGFGGDYTLVLKIQNGGINLRSILFGKVKIIALHNMVEITPNTCYLAVEDKDFKNKPINFSGIKLEDKINFVCTVLNPLKNEITVTPLYKTYKDTIYGEAIALEGGDISPISFKAGEKKVLNLSIPKANTAGDYILKTSFISGNLSSNSNISNYAINSDVAGVTAKILSASLNKDFYKKGDVAKFSILYNLGFNYVSNPDPSKEEVRDNKPIVVYLSATITDDNQKQCTPTINKDLEYIRPSGSIEIPTTITRDCKNPQIKLEMKDKNGTILDSKELAFKSGDFAIQEAEVVKLNTFLSSENAIMYVLVGVFVVAIIIIYLIIIKKRKDYINNNLPKSNETTI
jgi:hypothetical protein